MKKSLLYLSLIFIWTVVLFETGYAQDKKDIEWIDIESAQELVKSNSKPIFVDFTAKWCGWCKKMDKTTFRDTKVINRLSKGFYSVKMDFDSKALFSYKGAQYTGKQLAEEFGVTGLPTMIVISDHLDTVNTIVGYKTGKQLLKAIETF